MIRIATTIFAVVAFLLPVSGAEIPKTAVQWQVCELSFQAANMYERPYTEVALGCQFRGPDDRSYQIAGFYDGEGVWKIRFCPDRPGDWSWKTECNRPDTALGGKEGRFVVASAAETVSADGDPLARHGGILQVSANRRHLTYSDGTPFFWLGDTWWFCPGNPVPIRGSSNSAYESMFKTLIEKRQAQGFTVVHWASLGQFGEHSNHEAFMRTKNGGEFDPNYWKEYDLYVETANAAGIIPVIGFGFSSGLDPWSLEELEYLWRYVIARYGSHSASWLICGEYNQNGGDRQNRIEKVLKLGASIKEYDPYKRAMTVHPWYFKEETRDAWNHDWYDFVMWQGAHVGHGNVPPTASYEDSAKLGKPYLEGETQYEGIYGGFEGRAVTADDVRLSAWHAMQSGCCGYTYGAHGLWYPTQNADDKMFTEDWGFAHPWWEALQFPGPDQLKILKSFYEKIGWTRFRPRPDLLRLEGEYGDATRPLLQVAENDDENVKAVVYFPQKSGWDLAVRAEGIDAKYFVWFDPRTGEQTEAEAIATDEKPLLLPERPDDTDWVLMLQ